MKELDQQELEHVDGGGLAKLAVRVAIFLLAELADIDVAHAPETK